jgi:hypothetical protein
MNTNDACRFHVCFMLELHSVSLASLKIYMDVDESVLTTYKQHMNSEKQHRKTKQRQIRQDVSFFHQIDTLE